MKNKKTRSPRRSAPKFDSGAEEELAASVKIDDYIKPPAELDGENDVTVKPKRHYKPRAAKQASPSLGDFLVGLGGVFVGAVNSVLGEDMPLSETEKKMVKFSGDQLEEFGEVEDFNEQVGKYGWYLVGGSFVLMGLSRILPVLRKRRQGYLTSAQVVE